MDNSDDNYQRARERERSRSRERSEDPRANGGEEDVDYAEDADNDNNSERRGRRHGDDVEADDGRNVTNLYVTNLSFQTTEESLRAAFERFGEISSAQIIREPVSHTSRGFGFVSFVNLDEAERAVAEMHGGDVDGRSIRVEKARRSSGYQKTPGVYLGPPQLSSRFNRVDDRRGGGGYDRRSDRGGGYDRYPRGGGGYDRDYRGDRGGGGGYPYAATDRGYGGGGGYRAPPMYDRPPPYREERFPDARYDSYRGRDGPPSARYDRRGPPMGGPAMGGAAPAYFEGGGSGRAGRSPPVDNFRSGGGLPPGRGRSPPGAYRNGPPGRY